MGLKHHYWRPEPLPNLLEAGDAFSHLRRQCLISASPALGQAGKLVVDYHIIIVAREHELFALRLVDRVPSRGVA